MRYVLVTEIILKSLTRKKSLGYLLFPKNKYFDNFFYTEDWNVLRDKFLIF